jgi:ABC-2 type transport system permease protein
VNASRVRALLRKEWLEIRHNRTIVWTFIGLSALFTLLPLALAFGLPRLIPGDLASDPDTARVGEQLGRAYPAFAGLAPLAQFQVFLLRQFVGLFLLAPVMGAISVATYSIIGEKTTRSIEALLAAPVRTAEILVAKTLASAVPATVVTWIAATVFGLAVGLLAGPEVRRLVLDPAALALLALGVPLVALFGLGAGVIVSSRVSDPRSAQQVGAIIVLPVVALMVGQAVGLILLNVPMVLAGAAMLAVLDAVILLAGVKLFDREAILTRWR